MAQTKIKAGLFEGIIGNGTDGYFLMSNGDGTMTWSSVVINPTITSIAYPGSVTAADPAGGETITVTGTGFKTGATVTIGGTAAPSVSYVSATQITFTTPAKAAGDYDIVVTNTDTGSATFINGISYNGIPTWTTPAGSLGTFASDTTISTITLQATEPDAGTITFSITNGALPTGLSLTGANINGTTTLETADTLYTFTVTATDDESQATPRTFTITVTKQLIGTENFTINTYTGNGSTQSVEGKIGTAASFNGSTSKIDLPNGAGGTGAITVSTWINTNNISTTQGIWSFGSTSGYAVECLIESGYLFFRMLTSSGTVGFGIQTGTGYISNNTWHNIVCIFPNTTASNACKIYIDGVERITGTSTLGSVTRNTSNSGLGGRFYSGSLTLPFNGKIDQVRIFNKALSSSEVTTVYGENNASTTKSTTDIFNDGSGIALYEFEKGAKNTGKVVNVSDEYARANMPLVTDADFDGTTSGGQTVAFWFKTDTSGTGYHVALSSNTSQGGASTGSTIYIGNTTGSYSDESLGFWDYNGATVSVYHVREGSNTYRDGIYRHCAIVSTSTSKTIYINGVSKTISYSSSGSASGNMKLTDITFGGGLNNSSTTNCTGIKDVRVFEDALTSVEVGYLYNENASQIALLDNKLEYKINIYDGTPTNVSFVGTSFEPDLVWIKNRGTTNPHVLTDSIRGAGINIYSNLTNGNTDESAYFTSFDSNGFSLALSGGNTNATGSSYVAWCWKAGGTAVSNTDGNITSQVSANQAAGFSIVKQTSNNTDQTYGHGLSQAPEMIISKNMDVSGPWGVYHKDLGTGKWLYFNTTDSASTSANVYPTVNNTVFSGGSGGWNNLTYNYINYCFHSVDGYQKLGSYTGNGSSGGQTITGLGFNPRFLLVKNATASAAWRITDSVRGNNTYLYPNLANADDSSSGYISLITDGFRLNGLDSNSSDTYIYLAIA